MNSVQFNGYTVTTICTNSTKGEDEMKRVAWNVLAVVVAFALSLTTPITSVMTNSEATVVEAAKRNPEKAVKDVASFIHENGKKHKKLKKYYISSVDMNGYLTYIVRLSPTKLYFLSYGRPSDDDEDAEYSISTTLTGKTKRLSLNVEESFYDPDKWHESTVEIKDISKYRGYRSNVSITDSDLDFDDLASQGIGVDNVAKALNYMIECSLCQINTTLAYHMNEMGEKQISLDDLGFDKFAKFGFIVRDEE